MRGRAKNWSLVGGFLTIGYKEILAAMDLVLYLGQIIGRSAHHGGPSNEISSTLSHMAFYMVASLKRKFICLKPPSSRS